MFYKLIDDRYSNLAAGWTTEESGFDPQQGQKIFLYSVTLRLTLGPTQPPVQRVPWPLSPGVKRPGREAGHSPPSNAEAKNSGAIPPLPHKSSWRGG
jgi:hypothetical protein